MLLILLIGVNGLEEIRVKLFNAVYDFIECNDGIAKELDDYFTFQVENHFFMGKKGWDGKIHLFKRATKTIPNRLYCGLRKRLKEFCYEREIILLHDFANSPLPFTGQDALDFVERLNLPYKIRDYQLYAFTNAVRKQRQLILSPTGSGKSLIIYLLIRFLQQKRALIVVPTINLVTQMYNDFKEYGFDSDSYVHCIFSGQEKETTKPIILSTWQSIYDLPKEWFHSVDLVICDEVHGATAKSLKGIMENLINCHLRFGTTGTLDELPVHRLMLEGLFGPILKATSTSELIENKTLADLDIRNIVLKYPKEECKVVRDYQGEIDFLINYEKRNQFITNLALTCKGNTLVLFRIIEHGKNLEELIQLKQRHYSAIGIESFERPVFLIYGVTPGEEREEIRQILFKETEAIIVASYGVFSLGVNIPSLKNIIFGAPYKSKIKVLQSIGRGLRRIEGEKELCTLYDIADDLSYKKRMNYTLKHMVDRVKYYNEENFPYSLDQIELEKEKK